MLAAAMQAAFRREPVAFTEHMTRAWLTLSSTHPYVASVDDRDEAWAMAVSHLRNSISICAGMGFGDWPMAQPRGATMPTSIVWAWEAVMPPPEEQP